MPRIRLGRRPHPEHPLAARKWRIDNVRPKIIVVIAGTNNVGAQPRDDQAVAEIVRGLKAILDVCRQQGARRPRSS